MLASVRESGCMSLQPHYKSTRQLLMKLNLHSPHGPTIPPSSSGHSGKDPLANAGDARHLGSVPGLGRAPGEGSGNPLQCSCLENPTDRGAWWAVVHGVAESGRTERLAPGS